MFIILIGPDGCGKTTVADNVKDTLSKTMIIQHDAFSFGILPSISKVKDFLLFNDAFGDKKSEDGAYLSGMTKPESRLKGSLLAVWYGIDFVLARIFLRNKNIIMSRSYHDFLYQRAYKNVPELIPRLFLSLGPKPDHIVLLKRDAHLIFALKPELTVDEINSQFFVIEERLSVYPNFSVLVAPDSVTKTVDDILALVNGVESQ